MTRDTFVTRLRSVFSEPIDLDGNFVRANATADAVNQQQTNEVFSEKWRKYGESGEKEALYEFQRRWYLTLYGFASEEGLRDFLRERSVILDAGCGLGYKAAWLAQLAPHALVVGMDFSHAARQAATAYAAHPNLYFVQGDIARTGLRAGSIDYVSCDQVIMHTEDPTLTFAELARVTSLSRGQLACYFYAKKALPRELLDEHFRSQCKQMSVDELWQMAEQLTELGRRLSALKVNIETPAIPALGIRAGTFDIQRFVYWNFLKCFWSEELGSETSVVTNFDWYSPSNARRFSEREVRDLAHTHSMSEVFFHAEEACYSGRFAHARAAGAAE